MAHVKTSILSPSSTITASKPHNSSSTVKYGQQATVRETADDSFQKHDTGKLAYSLIPVEYQAELCRVLMHGAEKYGSYNWKLVDKRLRYFDAAIRHLYSWRSGEDLDSESGLTHLGHAAACVCFLYEMQREELGEDDR